ncbi:MAG: hypothetical protein JWN90_652 [Parcubacteria group bacterium]|nr:hypothetical protein [Parcubacteria group bacterium]
MLTETQSQSLANCKTFEDFRELVNDDNNTSLAALAFPGALNLLSSLDEAMRLFRATESLELELQKLAFQKIMDFITDDESFAEFESSLTPSFCGPNLSGWISWIFCQRSVALQICAKYEEYM